MFPFLPQITSVSVLKDSSNTFPLLPYFFTKTKDSVICECLYFLFSPANDEKYPSFTFPLSVEAEAEGDQVVPSFYFFPPFVVITPILTTCPYTLCCANSLTHEQVC